MVLGGLIFLNVCKLLDVDEKKDNLTSPLESFSESFSKLLVLADDLSVNESMRDE